MRYVKLTQAYKGTPLDNLQYIEGRLTNLQIRAALGSFMQGFVLPYMFEPGTFKYNWLLAVHAHNNGYLDEISQLVYEHPELLNYCDNIPGREFKRVFSLLENRIKIDCYSPNIFDTTISYRIVFMRSDSVYEVIKALQEYPFSLSHVSWHLHKHIFVYENIHGLINKILHTTTEDVVLYAKQSTNAIDSSFRPTERMISYVMHDHIRRVMAAAPLVLGLLRDLNVRVGELFDTLKQIADDLYDGYVNGDPESVPGLYLQYLHMYLHPHIAFLPLVQYAQYNDNIWPYSDLVKVTINRRLISSKLSLPVEWISTLLGPMIKLPEGTLTYAAIPTSTIPVHDVINHFNSFDTMFGAISYGADVKGQVAVTGLKSAAYDRYQTTDAEAQTYLNNIRHDRKSFERKAKKLLDGVLDQSLKIELGSLEHLVLCIYISKGVVARATVIINDEYTIRKEFNGSTIKMIAAYVYLFRQHYPKEANFIKEDMSVCFFGAENEPAIDILRSFYGSTPITLEGFGDRGIGAGRNRTNVFDLSATKTSYLFGISDIDQANYSNLTMANYEQSVSTVVYIAGMLKLSCKRSLCKVSMPSAYVINNILSALNKVDNSTAVDIVRLGAQKPMTYEVYAYLRSETGANKGFSWNPHMANYMQKFSMVLKRVPVTNILDPVVQFNNTEVIRITVTKDKGGDLLYASTIIGALCDRFVTRSSKSSVGYVTFSGRRSAKRQAIMLRQNANDSTLPYVIRNGKIYLTRAPQMSDFIASIPNGLGATFRGDHDVTIRSVGINTVMRHTIYEMVNAVLSKALIATLKKVVLIGGRRLDEIVAVRNCHGVKMEIIDPVNVPQSLSTYKITFLNNIFSYDAAIAPNSLVLCLYVIMNLPNGTPVSAADQMAKVEKLRVKIAASKGSKAFVQLYTDRAAATTTSITTNGHFDITKVATQCSVSVSKYPAVEMISHKTLTSYVSGHSDVTLMTMTYRDVLNTLLMYGVVLSDTGAMLLGLTVFSTVLLQIGG